VLAGWDAAGAAPPNKPLAVAAGAVVVGVDAPAGLLPSMPPVVEVVAAPKVGVDAVLPNKALPAGLFAPAPPKSPPPDEEAGVPKSDDPEAGAAVAGVDEAPAPPKRLGVPAVLVPVALPNVSPAGLGVLDAGVLVLPKANDGVPEAAAFPNRLPAAGADAAGVWPAEVPELGVPKLKDISTMAI